MEITTEITEMETAAMTETMETIRAEIITEAMTGMEIVTMIETAIETMEISVTEMGIMTGITETETVVMITEMVEISRTETIITTEMMTGVILEEMTEEMRHLPSQFRIKTENPEKIKYVRTDRNAIRKITKMAEERARMVRELTFQSL